MQQRMMMILCRWTLAVTAIQLVVGCQQQRPQLQEPPFAEKATPAPEPIRTFHEALDMAKQPVPQDTSGAREGCPGIEVAMAGQDAVPGTPWYEYLRCGCDFRSRIDNLLWLQCAGFKEGIEDTDENAALRYLFAASLSYELGRINDAQDMFRKAVYWMEHAEDRERELQAVTGRSDVKLYKGCACERAMAHFYLGLIAYQLGDYAEARREFYAAVLADRTKPAEERREKFAMLHYWLGKAYMKLGDEGNARVAMSKAAGSGDAAEAESLFDLEQLHNNNVTVLIQIGAGPTLVPKGADWHAAEYQPTEYPESACEVFVDGQHVGSAVALADLWTQISTQGKTKEQQVQESKAAAKAVLQNLPYINYFGVWWNIRGDVRSWSLLPGRFLAWTGQLPPGEHTVTVKFYDAQDYELTRYRQTWYFIPTSPEGETLLVLRSGRNKCNMQTEGATQ